MSELKFWLLVGVITGCVIFNLMILAFVFALATLALIMIDGPPHF